SRMKNPDISLEFYYSDEDITRKDKVGHRLYLSDEFDKTSGIHESGEATCSDIQRIRKGPLKIIDDFVFEISTRKNIALPKNNFAKHVLDRTEGFKDLDIREFRLIFELIRKISKVTPLTH